MAERAKSNRKNIMREFTINELSAVDRPAQSHARVVLMKRAETMPARKSYPESPSSVYANEVQALDFDAVMAEDSSRELTQRVKDCAWSNWNALQRSFDTIARDDAVSPADKVVAMKESIAQFLEALADESEDIAEKVTKALSAVPALAELLDKDGNSEGDAPMTDAEKKQLAELQETVKGLTTKLEAATAKEPAKKAAELQEQLDAATAEVAKLTKKLGDAKELVGKAREEYDEAVAKAGMSDAEKEHAASLDDKARKEFMGLSPEDRKKKVKKAVEDNPVIYKADDGQEYRKSDDPRLIATAKRADDSAKLASEERVLRETSELTKRADDVLKAFAGETKDKVEVLRGIAKMEAGPRAALEKMLEVGGKAIAAAFTTIGNSSEAMQKSAQDFNKRVSAIQERDKCSKSDAMSKARAEDPQAFEAYQGSQASGAN